MRQYSIKFKDELGKTLIWLEFSVLAFSNFSSSAVMNPNKFPYKKSQSCERPVSLNINCWTNWSSIYHVSSKIGILHASLVVANHCVIGLRQHCIHIIGSLFPVTGFVEGSTHQDSKHETWMSLQTWKNHSAYVDLKYSYAVFCIKEFLNIMYSNS